MQRRARGTVLIVTMWTVLVLVGLMLVFARTVRVEAIASANAVAGQQARSVATGALQYLLAQVDKTEGSVPSETDVSCEEVELGDGMFWLMGPRLDSDTEYAFRITDEASKINLNSATLDMLLKLPGMTSELAAAIVDWRDRDTEVSPGGAESEYYLLLEDPYYCKDSPLETVEEVLLVKGATQELLFGEDTNRNGVLDPNENDGPDSDPPDNADGHLDRGFFDYVTVYSTEPNQSAAGEDRVSVNDSDTQALSDLLRQFVLDDRFYRIMDRVRSGRPFRNVFDFYFRTGLTMDEFKPIADRLTTSSEENLVGLVNVNTAPREVLLCLPGLEEVDVDALLAARPASTEEVGGEAPSPDITWVAEALGQEKAVEIGGAITGRSFQFSADIIAVSSGGRAYRRFRAVADASQSPPRVLYWKDLTQLGWPLGEELFAALRAGTYSSGASASVGAGGLR
jgi:type II secretory pathway component PulK